MNTLTVMQNETQTIDSREVAEMVEKEHNKLLRDIRIYIEQLNQSNFGHVEFFQESSYQDGKGEIRPCYLVTRKGCEFIANKLTGVKGTAFTAKYINRFHDMEDTIKSGILENLSPELQAIFAHDARMQIQDRKISIVETRVDKLENTMVVDHGQGKELQDIGRNRVMTILQGRNSNAYKDKSLSKRVFAAIWRDYKEYFNINSYHNTPVARFEEAKDYLKNWVTDNNLQIEINMINRGEI